MLRSKFFEAGDTRLPRLSITSLKSKSLLVKNQCGELLRGHSD